MSKKVNGNAGKKRAAASNSRKGKVYRPTGPKLSEFAIMLKRAQFQAKRGINMPDEVDFDSVKLVNNAKEHLGNLYRYFGILIFVDGLIKEKVITALPVGIDLVQTGKEIVSLNTRLKNAPLLDDVMVFSLEIFEIGEGLQDLAAKISTEIQKVSAFGALIEKVISECGKTLPPKAEGERTYGETFVEVIRYIAEDFLYRNEILKPKQPEGETA